MTSLRTMIVRCRLGAMLLVTVALLLKAIVPAGYMVSAPSKVFTVEICADTVGERQIRQLEIPSGHGADSPEGHKSSPGCPFSSLWAGGFAGDLPQVVAAALAFILALGFAETSFPIFEAASFLRPPLRAPPRLA